jgi:hypothetical protein
LDPISLPKLRDKKSPAPILLDHLVVFDIDCEPFCVPRLEQARQAAHKLREWMAKETKLEYIHSVYSGSKGFHLVYHEPDRSLFGIEDLREREQAVRAARQELLLRVLDAGHPVDKTVTADTRRIIRLPGSLHGGTGWACTIIEDDWLSRPLVEWVDAIPRHRSARRMPKRLPLSARRGIGPLISAPRKFSKSIRKWYNKRSKRRAKARVERVTAAGVEVESDQAELPRRDEKTSTLRLQVSAHVNGTKDRSALVTWLPLRWSPASVEEKTEQLLHEIGLGPGLLFRDGRRHLLIVPRAIPQAALKKHLRGSPLEPRITDIEARGHWWVTVSPGGAEFGEEALLESVGLIEEQEGLNSTAHPFSRPHLELCRRLGQPLSDISGDVAGSAMPSMRIVQVS